MQLVKTYNDVPSIFENKFTYLFHRYPTNFSETGFELSQHLCYNSKYKISIRGPFFAAKVCQVMRNSTSLFKAKLRSKPLKMDNEVKLF